VKIKMVEERVGEELGLIDWSHPMIAEVETCRPQIIAMLREAEKSPHDFSATTDGGWPKVGWGDVLRVVMYDGWPYWRPMPTVVTLHWHGVSYNAFNAISEVRRSES
jgi:hypothetical protein